MITKSFSSIHYYPPTNCTTLGILITAWSICVLNGSQVITSLSTAGYCINSNILLMNSGYTKYVFSPLYLHWERKLPIGLQLAEGLGGHDLLIRSPCIRHSRKWCWKNKTISLDSQTSRWDHSIRTSNKFPESIIQSDSPQLSPSGYPLSVQVLV